MDQVWFVAALWLFLALIAVLVANWLKVSIALSEIVIGTVAQLAIGAFVGGEALGAKAPWITFLAGTGAIGLTFLAGAELGGRPGGLSLAFFRSYHGGRFYSGVALAAELARWSGAFDHFGRSRLCGDAGTRLQSDYLWQGHTRGPEPGLVPDFAVRHTLLLRTLR
jgi:hypothetical protein